MLWMHYSNEGGQVLVATATFIVILLLAIVVVGDIGETIVSRIQLQNASDAGALAGATVLKIAMDCLALSNSIVCSFYIGPLFKLPLCIELAFAVAGIQDIVIELAPYLSVIVAVSVAQSNGADMAFVYNDIIDPTAIPSLMVQRKGRIGKIFPGLIVDHYKRTKDKPYGDRFIRLVALKAKKDSQVGSEFSSDIKSIPHMKAVSEAATYGGTLNPLYRFIKKYKERLVPVSLKILELEFNH